MKKIILTTAAFAAFSASSALAIENDYYLKANVSGIKFTNVSSAKSSGDVFFGFGAGYHYMDNVRIDIMFDHYTDPDFKKNGVSIKGEMNSLLISSYVDLFDISVAKVFVGAGIGGSQVKAKVSGHTIAVGEPNAGQPDPAKNGSSKNKYNFAYALYLGTSAEFAPGTVGELTYSYRGLGSSKNIKDTSISFNGHSIGAGIRFDL